MVERSRSGHKKRIWLMLFAPLLTLATAALAFIAWAVPNDWRIIGLSTYKLFPLFGLMAFSLLWSQYIVLALAKWCSAPPQLATYFRITGYWILLCILLHPGLFLWQLWRDGFGLPPDSYAHHYVAPGMAWIVALGTISVLIFLTYELGRWFREKEWWRYVVYASDIAMLLVFYHGLRLGDQPQMDWYRPVWLFYGATYIIAVVYIRFLARRAA